MVAEVPTPWMCLQHDLRLAGVDPLARLAPLIVGRERDLAALGNAAVQPTASNFVFI